MDIKDTIIKQIQDALKAIGITGDVSIVLERPAESTHGDFSSNVAMVLAKKQKQNPRKLANEIVKKFRLRTSNFELLDKVEVAGPGFINFYLSNGYYLSALEKILQSEKRQFNSPKYKNKKIMVEFTDPNPFKEFHIGHLYSNIVGEAISRLLEAGGAEVWRVNYQGDVGLHVAKAIWGILTNFKFQISNFKYEDAKVQIEELENKTLEESAKFLGEAYALGSTAYEEDETAKEEIIEINKKVYAEDPQIMPLYERGKQWSLDYFETIYKRLGTEFRRLYFESEAGKAGLAFVRENLEKGIFIKSDGAVIFEGKKHRLHDRVFINSLGLPTYEAKELGLAPTKYKDFPYDVSIIITGNEVDEYFRVVLKALSIISPELGAKTRHISHGMVRLSTGKMSSRTGDVVTGEWLLDKAVEKANDIIQETKKTESTNDSTLGKVRVNNSDISATAEVVGLGAVKYALLKSSIGKDTLFDFDESVSFEGNSGPYLQYTFARIQSLLRKSKDKSYQLSAKSYQLEAEEVELLRLLTRFEEVVEDAAENYSPSTLATYLYELASSFNLFYQKLPILKGDEDIKTFRLGLSKAVGNTLKQGLELLGITAPEQM